MRLKPFFSWYGSKWSIIDYYPQPKHKTIIEPFAGSASYCLYHHANQIKLFDLDSNICLLWDYLIHVSTEEILGLPLLQPEQHIDDLKLTAEQKILIGFWLGWALTTPAKKFYKGPKAHFIAGRQNSTWCSGIKKRISNQLPFIRHWKIEQMNYEDIPNENATWFIDPPYLKKGYPYKHGSKEINYQLLSQWIGSRSGGVIACENEGANWMDFKPLANLNSNRNKKTKEVFFTNIEERQIKMFDCSSLQGFNPNK